MMTKVKNFFSEVKVELQNARGMRPKGERIPPLQELVDSDHRGSVIAMLLLGGYVALFDFIW